MRLEFYGDHSKLDPLTKSILLGDLEEEMREDGMSEEDIKIQLEMLKYEVFE